MLFFSNICTHFSANQFGFFCLKKDLWNSVEDTSVMTGVFPPRAQYSHDPDQDKVIDVNGDRSELCMFWWTCYSFSQ